MQKNKLSSKTAAQRGETEEQEGKAEEKEELKPEPAPQKSNQPKGPAYGFGAVDLSKVTLKKANN